MWIKCGSTNFRKKNCNIVNHITKRKKLRKQIIQIIDQIVSISCNLVDMSPDLLLLEMGRIKSSINLSSIVSRPKSSRTAPYAFIVFGRIILNFVSRTQRSKCSTYAIRTWWENIKAKLQSKWRSGSEFEQKWMVPHLAAFHRNAAAAFRMLKPPEKVLILYFDKPPLCSHRLPW